MLELAFLHAETTAERRRQHVKKDAAAAAAASASRAGAASLAPGSIRPKHRLCQRQKFARLQPLRQCA